MTFEELKPIVSSIIEKENATRDEKLKEICQLLEIKRCGMRSIIQQHIILKMLQLTEMENTFVVNLN